MGGKNGLEGGGYCDIFSTEKGAMISEKYKVLKERFND